MEAALAAAHSIMTSTTMLKPLPTEKGQEYPPLSNVCEYLNALHVYAEEARQDLRQCLIYDSHQKNARLIGIEYMVPRHIYESFPAHERVLWHSHEFEVKSGMLILPRPDAISEEIWEKIEKEAMKEVVGLYGKTFHFWEVDKGDEYPFGMPKLMGSLTKGGQIDLDEVLRERDERFGADYKVKKKGRVDIEGVGVHEDADSWYKA